MRKSTSRILGFAFAIAFILIIFLFSRMRSENLRASVPVSARTYELGQSGQVKSEPGTRSAARAKINPEFGEVFLESLDINLDADEDFEQIVIVHDTVSQNEQLSLVVADFQPLTGSHYRIWKGQTRATVISALVVQPRDFDGDGFMEILCHGIGNDNLRTLDIFGTATSSLASFKTIFSEAGLVIEVDDSDTGGVPVMVSNSAFIRLIPQADSAIERRFEWNRRSRTFELARVLPRQAASVDPAYADTILTGNPEDFARYLSGLWRKTTPEANASTLIGFDPETDEISLAFAGDQQIWHWETSSNAYLGMYAPLTNSTVPELVRLLTIELAGVDRIRIRAFAQQSVRFASSEPWNGEYERVVGYDSRKTEPSMYSIASDAPFMIQDNVSGISREISYLDVLGSYRSLEGIELTLGMDSSLLKQGSEVLDARPSIAIWDGKPILEMTTTRSEESAAKRLAFFISASFFPSGRLSSLRLESARFLAGGVESQFKPVLELYNTKIQGTR